MRVPIYKLKLVQNGSMICPPLCWKHPQIAALFFHRLIGRADREHAAALFLDAQGNPTGTSIISVGALNFTPLPAREVFKAALLANACGIILSHNHPGGSPTPSEQDIRVTKRLVEAGELLGIDVLDHIIITITGEFTSMREAGLLKAA